MSSVSIEGVPFFSMMKRNGHPMHLLKALGGVLLFVAAINADPMYHFVFGWFQMFVFRATIDSFPSESTN